MPTEFGLIERHFRRPARRARLGVGDDCALIEPAPGQDIAISTDLLVEGSHFLPGTDPRRLGHKTLAVNLSDLAAMGATPRYATLTLSLPDADEAWIAQFAAGFFALADRHAVELVGGDTTRGPLTLGVTILGEVPRGTAIRRDGAADGEDVWVSGTLGDAALGLAILRGEFAFDDTTRRTLIERLECPEPRLALGLALRGVASAMIDLSDGLGGDLAHIARASRLCAVVRAHDLPLHPALAGLGAPTALRLALGGGDDYELCFAAPPARRAEVVAAGASAGVAVTRVGSLATSAPDVAPVRLVDAAGRSLALPAGFDHFAALR
jgi:thiamine-monophosphate kinase